MDSAVSWSIRVNGGSGSRTVVTFDLRQLNISSDDFSQELPTAAAPTAPRTLAAVLKSPPVVVTTGEAYEGNEAPAPAFGVDLSRNFLRTIDLRQALRLIVQSARPHLPLLATLTDDQVAEKVADISLMSNDLDAWPAGTGHWPALANLNVSYNHIREIPGDAAALDGLPALQTLDVRNNLLEDVAGLQALASRTTTAEEEEEEEAADDDGDDTHQRGLVHLSLSCNCLTAEAFLRGCPLSLPSLKILGLFANQIEEHDDLEELFAEVSARVPNLNHIYLLGNPISTDPSYETRVRNAFPKIQTIDGRHPK